MPEALIVFNAMMAEAVIAALALLLLMVGAFVGNRATVAISHVACLGLLVAVVLLWQAVPSAQLLFHDRVRVDGFTHYAQILIALGAMMALLLSQHWLSLEVNRRFEYPVLLLLSVLGLMLMVSANDLLSIYMALELASLALYVMAAIDRDNSQSSEAGLKYFVLGALASGMMLFGASLIYGFAGSTNFETLAKLFAAYSDQPVSPAVVLGLVLMLAGFCFKISAVPFHMWTPDVYEGAPTPVVAFFAVAPKVAALALLARFVMQPFGLLFDQWQQIILVVSVASMVVGAFGALRQTNIKRLLAYSSIGHVGYALVGLAAGNIEGVQAMLIYLSLYLFMSVGTFGFVLLMKRDSRPVEQISELGGLAKTAPKSAFFVALMMFSMAGIPPLSGFFGKFYVFLNAVGQGMYGVVIIGLLSSVVAAYYYIKLVKIMYFDDAKPAFDLSAPLLAKAVMVVCALVTMFFFVLPSPLLAITAKAAKALAM